MIQPKISKKQSEALELLDPQHPCRFPFYGGAAGGGKSDLGCYWLQSMGYYFPDTRWFIGRDSLKDTRESVLITWGKVAKRHGFEDWRFSENSIIFKNGSSVTFLDLSFYPQKDPMFERLGSKEYTGGWIEEAGEVHFAAFDTLKSRVGRHMNQEYSITPKILITANPKKNWLYTIFWKPFRDGVLPAEYGFVRSLYTDNPFLPEDYKKNLNEITDPVKRARLIYGDFDYDDNPNSLCSRDNIMAIFGKNAPEASVSHFITADIARFGSDKAIVLVWKGLSILEYITFDISKTTDIEQCIEVLRRRYKIPLDRIIIDEDGVGGGVVDTLNARGFVNNSSCLFGENYINLQSQCGYKLAEKINAREIVFECDVPHDLQDNIAIELEQLQTWKSDSDGKLRIKPKAEIKLDIGRSPDWRDALLMRMLPELSPEVNYQSNLESLSIF